MRMPPQRDESDYLRIGQRNSALVDAATEQLPTWQLARNAIDATAVVVLVTTGTVLMMTVFAFLPSRVAAAGAFLAWLLLALAWIDWKTGRLPDVLTLPLCGAGLALATATGVALDHFIGAAIGFAGFSLVALVYRRMRGHEGLGGGDVKLFSAIGAWVGWQPLSSVLLMSCLAALVFAALVGRTALLESLRFGPFLAAGAWLVWFWEAAMQGQLR